MPDQKERIARWRAANAEHLRTYSRERARRLRRERGVHPKSKMPDAEYRERRAESLRKWRLANPDATAADNAAQNANKRARRLGITDRLMAVDVLTLWATAPTCLTCGAGRGVDHVVPMRDGGLNQPSNLQNLCSLCNTRKENGARALPIGHPNYERARKHRERMARHAGAPTIGVQDKVPLG